MTHSLQYQVFRTFANRVLKKVEVGETYDDNGKRGKPLDLPAHVLSAELVCINNECRIKVEMMNGQVGYLYTTEGYEFDEQPTANATYQTAKT